MKAYWKKLLRTPYTSCDGNNSYRTIYLCANYLYNLTNVNIEKRF